MSRHTGCVFALAMTLACGRSPSPGLDETSSGEGTGSGTTDSGTEASGSAGSTSASTSGSSATSATTGSDNGADATDTTPDDGDVSTDGEATGVVFDIDDPPPLDLGTDPDCAEPPPAHLFAAGSQIPDSCAPIDIEGFVLAANDGSFTVDACPCDLDCTVEDPHEFELEAPGVAVEFGSLITGQCVRVRGQVHESCDETYLNVMEVNPEFDECALLTHYSNYRVVGGGVTAQYSDQFPGVALTFDEDGDSCSFRGQARTRGSLYGTVMDLPFDVSENEGMLTDACTSSFVQVTAYEVVALAAQSTESEAAPGIGILAELFVQRSTFTIPPP